MNICLTAVPSHSGTQRGSEAQRLDDTLQENVFDAVRAFAKMGKLWKIHFRNVTAPIPYFVETYIDNGYTDMWKLMKTLVDVDFRGNLIADHVPAMAGGRNSGWSYSMGYIRALYAAAQAERKRG